jgi:glycerol transport system substrate-binding protein
VGLTFIRESTIFGTELHRARAQAGRPGRVLPLARPACLDPTGVNVPDYPKLAQLWWQNIGEPKAKLANEKPKGETVDYDKLIRPGAKVE